MNMPKTEARRNSGPVALAAGGLVLVLASCAPPSKPPPPPPPSVLVMEVTATNVPLWTEFIGQLDSPQNVEVRARVEAFVDQVLFTEGTEVREGDPLFALDAKPYVQKLAAAEGSLGEAKAALLKYQTDVARLQPLAEKRAIPQQDLDNAVASVSIGQANIQSAVARVEAAKLDLGYCDVRAPIAGLIGAKQVSVGSLVGKGEPTLLATISQLDPIWFYCTVPEVQFLAAQAQSRRTGRQIEDMPVTLVLATGTPYTDPGRFVFIDRAVDTKTGTLRMRAEFRNADKLLRPGMFGRIRVNLGEQADSLLVPERAVTELQGKTFVWTIGPDNKAEQRPVQVGKTVESRLMILEGIKAGDRVVVEGLQKVREGAPVQPVQAGPQAGAADAPAKPVDPNAKE